MDEGPEGKDRDDGPGPSAVTGRRFAIGPSGRHTRQRLHAQTETGIPPTGPPDGRPGDVATPDGSAKRSKDRGGIVGFLLELPVLLLIAFVLALLIKTFLVQAFFIPSESMVPTLGVGDRVLVNKVVYRLHPPDRGDVIVFEEPGDGEGEDRGAIAAFFRWLTEGLGASTSPDRDFIKRVIGLPGEVVELHRDSSDRCQVYIGSTVEYPAMDKAVNDSRGQVVTFGGGLASTVYSANAGGHSATPAEGFGGLVNVVLGASINWLGDPRLIAVLEPRTALAYERSELVRDESAARVAVSG